MNKKHILRQKRHTELRTKVRGTAERPRVAVYRGLRHLYVQVIDDTAGKTLFGLSDKKLATKGTGIERAQVLGKELAKLAAAQKVKQVVFDRGGFRYHGQVKAVADTLREEGLTL